MVSDLHHDARRVAAQTSSLCAVYDATRTRLLRGRNTLVRLCAAHLRQMQAENPRKPLVWVDIGGGTGKLLFPFQSASVQVFAPAPHARSRLEHRGNGQVLPDQQLRQRVPDRFMRAVRVSPSVLVFSWGLAPLTLSLRPAPNIMCIRLLEVARKRFAARGWKNVHVLCQDATFFSLPEWESGEVSARGAVRYIASSLCRRVPSYRRCGPQFVHVELFALHDPLVLCASRSDRRLVGSRLRSCV